MKPNILITGGAGFLGAHYVKMLLTPNLANRIIVYSRDELKHFHLKMELGEQASEVEFMIGDVRDYQRLASATADVDILIHAAALKQVEACEDNSSECLKTNVVGTENVIRASQSNGVRQLVFISTDKAVEPLNIYGNSKQAGEKLVLKANSEKCATNVIRLGNLIGSPGSLADKLHRNPAKQIVLHDPQATRFIGNLAGAWQMLEIAFKEIYNGTILIPRLKAMSVASLIQTLDPLTKIEEGVRRTYEKSHEKLASDSEMKRALEIDSCMVIPPDSLAVDLALARYQGVPTQRSSYSSEQELVESIAEIEKA